MPGAGLAFLEDSIVMAFAEKTDKGILLAGCAGAPAPAYSPYGTLPAAGFKNALAEILSGSLPRVKDVAISIPDIAVKAVVLEFTELPDNRQEAEEVIKWKAAKGFSARPEDCILGYQTMAASKGKKVFAAIADRKIIEGYEDAVSEAGLGVSVVGIHSLNALNLLSEALSDETGGSFFAVTASKSFFSVMAVRDGATDFYRCKETGEGVDATQQIEATFASYKGKNPDANMDKAYILGSAGGISGVQVKEISVSRLVSLGTGVSTDGIPSLGVMAAAGAAAAR
ncbi:MAG TPA: hypothetical protein VFF54_00485 [Thermodesulfobacteriota bacterium]|nr:hypothetical protein [Thermodesulfobacteriota bacterium]